MPIKADKRLIAYYNEVDGYAAQWLRNLIAEQLITKGDVDERTIKDVRPNELAGYDRAHFFAGVGVWDYALNQSKWGRSEIWTGSCPCQPFSAAGNQTGVDDERHLWPVWSALINECRPPVVFGEQVAAAIGHSWLDTLQTDLEAQGYAVGAAVLGAHSVGAPHIRQRLYFVADSQQHDSGFQAETTNHRQPQANRSADWPSRCGGAFGGLVDSHNDSDWQTLGRGDGESALAATSHGAHLTVSGKSSGGMRDVPERRHDDAEHDVGALADSDEQQRNWSRSRKARPTGWGEFANDSAIGQRPSPTNGFWRDADWLLCRDGRWRPVESTTERMADGLADSLGYVCTGQDSFGLSPLIKGATNRAGRLKAYGNAICAETAKEFIAAFMECRP